MDYFCFECSHKAGWEWVPAKAFQHSCQRCFRNVPCNDYGHKKAKVHIAPAPTPKDLVAQNVNSQSEVTLPRAKGVLPTPVPVYEVEAPAEAPALVEAPVASEAPCSAPVLPTKPDERNEADKALDAVQPNRPGIKAIAVDKSGRPIAPAKQAAKFEVDETGKKQ